MQTNTNLSNSLSINHLPTPPGPSFLRMLTYTAKVWKEQELHHVIADLADIYGPVISINTKSNAINFLLKRFAKVSIHPYILVLGPEANRFLTTSNPQLIQRSPTITADMPSKDGISLLSGMTTLDDESHAEQRRFIMQFLKRDYLTKFVPSMTEICRTRISTWNGQVNLFDEMKYLTIETLAYTVLGIEPGSQRSKDFLTHYWPMLQRENSSKLWLAKENLWTILAGLVSEKRTSTGIDILSSLASASENKNGCPLNNEEDIVGWAYILTESAHADLTIFLTCAILTLLYRPDLLERFRAEYERDAGQAPYKFDFDPPFTLNFLREVERLYSPTPFIVRYAAADLAFKEYYIPRGSWLIGSLYHTHRMPTLFANPSKFDPDRFAPPREEHKTPFALMGFGSGYHSCLGKFFAHTYISVVLHTLFVSTDYDIHLVGKPKIPSVDRLRNLLQPCQEIAIEITYRT